MYQIIMRQLLKMESRQQDVIMDVELKILLWTREAKRLIHHRVLK